jgi:hypothetical protein
MGYAVMLFACAEHGGGTSVGTIAIVTGTAIGGVLWWAFKG